MVWEIWDIYFSESLSLCWQPIDLLKSLGFARETGSGRSYKSYSR